MAGCLDVLECNCVWTGHRSSKITSIEAKASAPVKGES